MKLSRRQLLKIASAAPLAFVPRLSRAQQASVAGARARQLLVIYCSGGLRSHSLFSFDGAPKSANPYGVDGSPANARVGFRLASPSGGRPDDAPLAQAAEFLPEWGIQLPSLFGATGEKFSLLSPVDHNPGGDAVLDWQTARNLMGSGRAQGGPGLFSLISDQLGTSRPLPPFCLGDDAAIFAKDAHMSHSPVVSLRDPFSEVGDGNPLFPYLQCKDSVSDSDKCTTLNSYMGFVRRADKVRRADWELRLSAALDDDLAQKLPAALQSTLQQQIASRGQLSALAEFFARPQMQFRSSEFAAAAFEKSNGQALSNRRLEQAFLPFLRFPSGGFTTNSNFRDPLGAKMAMAVRMLQYGSPAVAVSLRGFDLHKDEDKLMPQLSRPLGRAIAGLLFVLGNMPGVEKPTRLDETLVVVVSEWGRDGVREDTGYNDQGGSDHRGGATNRYQVLPIFGAGVRGGRVIGGLSPELRPIGKTFSSAQLAATLVGALGLETRGLFDADPIEDVFA